MMSNRISILETPIEFLKGVGPNRGELFRKELGIHTFKDLLYTYPFRYIDKTSFQLIKDIYADGQQVMIKGTIISKEVINQKGRRRLNAIMRDGSGFIQLVWFQGIKWVVESIEEGKEYTAFGKVKMYKGSRSIPHPELEIYDQKQHDILKRMDPVYSSTEKLDARGISSKVRRNLMRSLLEKVHSSDVPEFIPTSIIDKLKLCSRWDALKWIHLPPNKESYELALNRLKFEELFLNQLILVLNKERRRRRMNGAVFSKVGDLFNNFYHNNLKFELTGAQKRVLKEIRHDLGSGCQMNRLLQGDVGSGKTIVALMSMLIALDNGFQACLMAPTEILAQQHFASITSLVEGLSIKVAFLSGNVKGKKRKELLKLLESGHIHILIGTHALIEEHVVFSNLGLAITDEQHRFGVGQRARMWKKNEELEPHILVMTATPIPRTLAMTRYGDLDVSVIDEMPPGRKEIKTIHRHESSRPKIDAFLKAEILKGRQVYVVYPLIEESEKLDLQNLQDGYERMLHNFPRPEFQISVVHGRMKADDKDFEMQRFVRGETQIMVATTVIEVGVNVPNATVMVVENAERFGLSQLHQLRGRVGRGGDQSYCVLMSGYKLSKYAKERLQTMVRTNDGFQIAEADMLLRGPGDISGTQQSGLVDFKVANLIQDQNILQVARHFARNIIEKDPGLMQKFNSRLKKYLSEQKILKQDWGRIS
jgi:ATP-dependent DNA helicase RecG